ncbi:hypothetical protein INT45_004672, partial [Circinella minor]
SSNTQYDRQHINDDAESMVSSTPTLIQPPPEEQRRFLRHNNHSDGYHHLSNLQDVEEQAHEAQSEQSFQRRDGFMRLGSGGNLIQTNNNDNGVRWVTVRGILMGPTDRPWFIWLSAVTMIVIMIFEIAKHHDALGSMIQTDPLNPMIGPTFTILINSGARYTPCMRSLPDYEVTTIINNCYSNNATCTLEQLCGGSSNQGYRFFSPIFIHAGIIHVIVNLLIHFQVGSDIERDIGFLRFGFLYLVSGTWGFALSSLLSPAERASMGCSGALMGLVGYLLVDTLMNWKSIRGRTRRFISLLVSIILIFLFGIFPGFDNFAHLGNKNNKKKKEREILLRYKLKCIKIGGFLTGIIIGVLLISPVGSTSQWITWGVRVVALTLLVVVFVIMLYMFYSAKDPTKICPNCKYFSCVPVSNWCDI